MSEYNIAVCQNEYGNTGQQKYCGSKGKVKSIVLVPSDASIATKVLALTESTWLTNINAAKSARWFPIERVVETEPTQEDPVFQEMDYGDQFFVRNGKKSAIYTLNPRSVYNKNELAKLNGTNWSVYLITDLNKILGTSTDLVAGTFDPYSCDYVRILPESEPSGSETELIRIAIMYSDVTEFDGRQVVIEPLSDSDAPAVWYPLQSIKGIKDLRVSSVTGISTTGATITIVGYGGTAYNSAVAADVRFNLASDLDTDIALSSLTPSGNNDGVYTAVWASQSADDYVIGLLDQPEATTQGVETPNLTAFTIS